MTNGAKKVAFYAGVGVLAAILIISSVGFSGLKFPSLRFPDFFSPPLTTGTLTILITDKPVDELEYLNITIDWAKIKDQGEDWHNLTLKSLPFHFDLLALQNVSETLSETGIPAGNYTMIWMHVLTANATYPDGNTTTLNVPSDIIKVILNPHLRMEVGGAITVLIDLQPDDLKSIAISRSLNLRPVIKARVNG